TTRPARAGSPVATAGCRTRSRSSAAACVARSRSTSACARGRSSRTSRSRPVTSSSPCRAAAAATATRVSASPRRLPRTWGRVTSRPRRLHATTAGGGAEMEELARGSARLVDDHGPGPRRDLVGYGRRVPKVRWPGDARLAVNIVVNYEEGSEYSHPAGDGRNETTGDLASAMPREIRDLRTESAYEYGSRAGIWRLVRLL